MSEQQMSDWKGLKEKSDKDVHNNAEEMKKDTANWDQNVEDCSIPADELKKIN